MIRKTATFLFCLALAAGLFGVLPAPSALAATITWDGGAGTSNWNDANNWNGNVVPSATDEVILDNSSVSGSYTVNLPSGAITVAIARLTITPGAGNTISLVLPSTNTANPGFNVGDATASTDDIVLDSGAVLINSSGASNGNGIQANSTTNGTVRINNGARYVHNTGRSTAGVVPLLSTATGTETGVFEYDSPGTGSTSIGASGRTYGSLTLTRSAGPATYASAGGSALTVRGNFLINSGVTYNSTMTAPMNLAGNLTNDGAALSLSQPLNFNGTATQTISGSGAVTLAGTATLNNAAGLSLGRDVTISGATLTLTSGLLTLGTNTLTLGSSTTIGGTPSAANMIVADGAGSLCKTYGAAGAFTFPIGDNTSGADYSPATLNFTAGTFGSGAQACVRVTDEKHPQNSSVNHYLTRYWTVTQSNIADFDCDAEFNYVDADIVGTESRIYTGKWDSAWTQWALANTVGNLIGDTFGSFSDITGVWPYILVDDPTAITLADFYAQQTGDAIEVIWETASELDNRGFNLYRGTSPDGWDRRLNDALIPSQSQGSPAGFFYTWTDQADLTPGTTYYYWLQDMDLSGALTTHGPVSVDFTVPTAVTLGSVQASPGLDTLRYSTHAAAASLSWLWIVAGAGAALGASRLRRRA